MQSRVTCARASLALLCVLGAARGAAQSVAPFAPRLSALGVGTGPVNGGRVHAIAVHPADARRIVVATEFGGLWRSPDGGTTWVHLPNLDATFVVDVAYADSGAVLVATVARDMTAIPSSGRGGVWVSRDDGGSWARVAAAPPGGTSRGPTRPSGRGVAVALHDARTIVAGTDYGIVLSTDGGARWTASAAPGYAVDRDSLQDAVFSVLPLSGGRVLATTRSGVWLRAGDGGWRNVRAGDATAAGVHALAPWPGRGDAALFLDLRGVPTLRTYDATADRWRGAPVPRSPIGRGPFLRVGMDAERPGARAIWLGVPPNLLRASCASLDCVAALELESWVYSDRGSHADPGDVGLDGGLRPVLYGNDGGLFRPTDAGGRSWALATRPEALNTLQIASLAGTHLVYPYVTSLYLATQDNGIWASDDGGALWRWRDCEGSWLETIRYGVTAAASPVSYGQIGCDGEAGARLADGNLLRARDLPTRGPGGRRLIGGSSAISLGEHRWLRVVPSRGDETQDVYVSDDDARTWRLRALVPFPWYGTARAGVARGGGGQSVYLPYRLSATGADAWGTGIGLLRIDGPLDRRLDWVGSASPQLVRLPSGGSLGVRATMFDWRAVYGVNPQDPDHVIAPDVVNDAIWVTRDGGRTWRRDDALRDEVTRGGALLLHDHDPYRTQVTEIAFDPAAPNRIFVGTRDAGIVYSGDGGASWRRVPGSERVRYVTGFVPRRNSRTVVVSSYGHGLWLFDPGTLSIPFVAERMCFGIRCIVRLPPDAEVARVTPDWKRLEVVIVGGGRVVGLTAGADGVTRVEVSPQSTTARFVPPDVPLRALPVDAVPRPSGFGPWQKLVDRVPAGESIVGVALDAGRVAALVTSSRSIDPNLVDAVLAEATPPARVASASATEERDGADAAPPMAMPASLTRARAAAQQKARVPIVLSVSGPSEEKGPPWTGVPVVVGAAGLRVRVSGLVPRARGGAPASVELDGRVVQEAAVAADGSVTAQLRLPATLAIGPHTVRVVQPAPNGERVLTAGFAKAVGDREERKP